MKLKIYLYKLFMNIVEFTIMMLRKLPPPNTLIWMRYFLADIWMRSLLEILANFNIYTRAELKFHTESNIFFFFRNQNLNIFFTYT
jgi:hypothetical protein